MSEDDPSGDEANDDPDRKRDHSSEGYELTRRDALAALAAAGAAGGVGVLARDALDDADEAEVGGDETEPALAESDRETLVAVAETIYPSEVTGIPAFVERYVVGRVGDRPGYAAGVHDAVAILDEYAETWAGRPFREATVDRRDELLRRMGVNVSEPDPDGVERQRVRYYLVNDLQFALYASPTGGRLVGIENPQGHPGGTRSYRRPPPDEREE